MQIHCGRGFGAVTKGTHSSIPERQNAQAQVGASQCLTAQTLLLQY